MVDLQKQWQLYAERRDTYFVKIVKRALEAAGFEIPEENGHSKGGGNE